MNIAMEDILIAVIIFDIAIFKNGIQKAAFLPLRNKNQTSIN